MKNIFSLLIILFCFSSANTDLLGQEYTRLKLYSLNWNTFYKVPVTKSDIINKAEYELIDKSYNSYFNSVTKSELEDTLKNGSKSKYSNRSVFSVVILRFGLKKIKIYFNRKGEYCFDGQWYEFNEQLFTSIFGSLSINISPKKLAK